MSTESFGVPRDPAVGEAGDDERAGPSADELQTILTIGARVPDHKMMVPWRFVVFEGEARARFGEALVAACKAEEKEPPSDVRLETERARFLQAPLVVGVISRSTR